MATTALTMAWCVRRLGGGSAGGGDGEAPGQAP
jgi:hypothetical protein